jgi:hypothetical protein
MTEVKDVRISITREMPSNHISDVVARFETLASVLGIDAEEAETEWNWSSGSSVPIAAKPGYRLFTDNFHKDFRTNRQRLEDIIEEKFPHALMVFFTDDDNMAAVEDAQGNMNRVWPDGQWENYKR